MVVLRLINHYYFVYSVDWSKADQIVTIDLEGMGLLINRELGMEKAYMERKFIDKSY
ncbi:hypothetical protein [Oceanobacillus polygoni]|uniref:Uncharacterized protein n=1 Tax=Oceanobacillus polygoni TaxID=1235259 RepID=A0A9X0YWW3_9BACI|nr:hypothetical protein [Oceanobacillus polygoni]MBP2080107.1 hypothetical protein [Oceanobacillus polygoni]